MRNRQRGIVELDRKIVAALLAAALTWRAELDQGQKSEIVEPVSALANQVSSLGNAEIENSLAETDHGNPAATSEQRGFLIVETNGRVPN